MMEQIDTVRPRLVAATGSSGAVRAGVAALLRELVAVLEDNRLNRRLLTHPDELQAVSDQLGSHELDGVQDGLVSPLVEYVARAQRDGAVVEADPMTVIGVFQAVLLVPVNRGEFDPARYDAILDLPVDTVAAGLTTG